ncbi:MAG: alpha/beta hydrolase, partial [Trebonia sp.]
GHPDIDQQHPDRTPLSEAEAMPDTPDEGAAPGGDAGRPPWWHFPRTRRYLAGFPPAGLTGALAFYCLSLTPSLLPREWYLQAAMSAVTVAIGYGLGLLAGWLLRSLVRWRPGRRLRLAARLALAVAAVVLIPLFGVLGAQWQHQIRELTEASQPSEANYILVVLVTVLLSLALIMAARAIRWVVRQISRLVSRIVPDRAGAAVTVLVICVVLLLLLTGALSRGALGAANSLFGGVDTGTSAGVVRPASPMRSGSAESLVPWDTLGRQGRTFVDGGPTATEIARFTGQRAMEPIRVYAGLQSAPTIEAESALVLRELQRTGAFDRKVLVVATTTGTGWLNPAMIDPLEYMYDGDSAVAAMQYSFLPSWMSFIADKGPAQEAGRDLFDAVYGAWSRLPADHRPRLVVFGESLGSFGGEAAFSGVNDIRNRTSGVLWVGPTNSNTLWHQFTADRTPGSPEWQPSYRDGKTVRFVTALSQLDQVPADWAEPRVVYLQNTSDPIVWWSWSLAFHQPDWLRGAHPPGVSSAMHWYPLVTFWQVAADLALAMAVPAGHGHTYGMRQGAAAWAAIVPPAGWSADRTAALGKLTAD